MPTFKDLYTHLNLLASEEDGDDFQLMAKREINFTYKEILSEGDNDLERREFTLTTRSGTAKYGMPIYVSQVLNIEDDTNDRMLTLRGPHEFDRNRAGLSEPIGLANMEFNDSQQRLELFPLYLLQPLMLLEAITI